MELGIQIKKYRTELNLSQEELAEKVFVSRQTISNWENDKNYPDIKSLILLSEIFKISIDELIKGDIDKMKIEISAQEFARFKKDSDIFTSLLIAMIVLPVPLAIYLKWTGIAIYLTISSLGMYYAFKIEKYKKKYDIQTYKEIMAFLNGESLTEIEKAREDGKRIYQKIFLSVATMLAVVLIAIVMSFVIEYFK